MKWSEHDLKHIKKGNFRTILINWAKKHPVDFPWRGNISQFHALIAEILLQRTKAEQVVPVFNEFRSIFPTATKLASSRITSVRLVIRPLGLVWRAEFLKLLGQDIVKNNDIIPDEYNSLLALPGVGHYTASAYLSLHRRIRRPIIDSNIVRLYCRLLNESYDGETRRKSWIILLSDQLTPKTNFRQYNYALLDFTREVCKPKPDCRNCPLTSICCKYNDKRYV